MVSVVDDGLGGEVAGENASRIDSLAGYSARNRACSDDRKSCHNSP